MMESKFFKCLYCDFTIGISHEVLEQNREAEVLNIVEEEHFKSHEHNLVLKIINIDEYNERINTLGMNKK